MIPWENFNKCSIENSIEDSERCFQGGISYFNNIIFLISIKTPAFNYKRYTALG
jgi:hypothetical protein